MTIAYHGTNATIQEFNLDTMGYNTANNGGAIFFTDDKEVAWNYSKEAFIRKNEEEFYERRIWDKLKPLAEKQAHFYEVELDIRNPLYINIEDINQDQEHFCRMRGLYNVLDAHLLNHIVNILQERRYEKYYDCWEEETDCKALDFLVNNEIIEHYDKETDEYIEHELDFDCIIIENTVDSINEETNYIESTIYVVLDPSIIKIKNRLTNY